MWRRQQPEEYEQQQHAEWLGESSEEGKSQNWLPKKNKDMSKKTKQNKKTLLGAKHGGN